MMARKMEEGTEGEEDLIEAFKVFDVDGNGVVQASELHALMTQLGERVSEAEVLEIIAEHDIDGDGMIDYDEFIRMVEP